MFNNYKAEEAFQEIKKRREFLLENYGELHPIMVSDFMLNYWYNKFEKLEKYYTTKKQKLGIIILDPINID